MMPAVLEAATGWPGSTPEWGAPSATGVVPVSMRVLACLDQQGATDRHFHLPDTGLRLETYVTCPTPATGRTGPATPSRVVRLHAAGTARTCAGEVGMRKNLRNPDDTLHAALVIAPMVFAEQEEHADGSTSWVEQGLAVFGELEALCRSSRDEHFEDGMESAFSRELVRLVAEQGLAATNALAVLFALRRAPDHVAAEAARWLGLMEHGPSHRHRRLLLEYLLFSPSPDVRYGATLGLAFLDSPHAIRYMRRAIDHEQREWLRARMSQVLAQLEATAKCLSL